MKHFFTFSWAASPATAAGACARHYSFAASPLLRRTGVLLGLLLSSALGAQAQPFFRMMPMPPALLPSRCSLG